VPEPFVVGVDPSSKTIALVAKHPVIGTVSAQKYILAKKAGPEACSVAMEVMQEWMHQVDQIAPLGGNRLAFIEAPVIGKGGARTTMVQAFVSGVIQACFIQGGFNVYLVQNTAWKRVVVGDGSASKDACARAIAGRWPRVYQLAQGDQDLLDAAAICIYGRITSSRAGNLAGASGL
jgi:Holliday junction resolvasome RuvABC endonuclease subunit